MRPYSYSILLLPKIWVQDLTVNLHLQEKQAQQTSNVVLSHVSRVSCVSLCAVTLHVCRMYVRLSMYACQVFLYVCMAAFVCMFCMLYVV